jgi:hypothetical protein
MVQVPVADDGAQPAVVLAGREREEPHRPLAALVIAVEELDQEDAPAGDRILEPVVIGVVRIADCRLPEADLSRADVEVSELRTEFFGCRCLPVQVQQALLRSPSLQDGDPIPALRSDIAR